MSFNFKEFQKDVCNRMFEDPSDRMPVRSNVQEVINYKPEPSKRKNQKASKPGSSSGISSPANTTAIKKRGRPPGIRKYNSFATSTPIITNSSQDHSLLLSQISQFSPMVIASLIQQAMSTAAAGSLMNHEVAVPAPVPVQIVQEKPVALEVSGPEVDVKSPPKKRKISFSKTKVVSKPTYSSTPKPKRKLITPRSIKNSPSTSKQDSDDSSNESLVGTPKSEFELFKENQDLKNKEQGVRRSIRRKWKVECKVEIIQKTFEEIHSMEEFLHIFRLEKKFNPARVRPEDSENKKMDVELEIPTM